MTVHPLACVLAPKRALKLVFLPPKRAVYHVLTSQGGSLVCFANQEGTLARVLIPRRALYRTFWLPGGHFIARFDSQKGALARVWLPEGHFSARFGSQEGTLARVFQQSGHEAAQRPMSKLMSFFEIGMQFYEFIVENNCLLGVSRG